MSKLKLSVCTITYNHEEFIAQAIESVLMQKTDFDIEMIIGEDCSTDNTRSIVKKYADNYPGIVKPIYYDTNVGGSKNSVICLQACSGEYVAMLEGDDYWTDPCKIQKQVDFMEKNKDYSICYHKVDVIDFNTGEVINVWPTDPVEITAVDDLARVNYIPTVSCVFRNRIKDTLPDWFSESPIGDYCLHMINAKYGNIKYINENMAVYRRHSQGMWAGASIETTYVKLFKAIDYIKREFVNNDNYDNVIERLQLQQYVLVGKLLSSLSKNEKNKFFMEYSEELSDLISNSWEKIYSNNISLQSKGARLGINFAKTLRRLLGK